MSGIENGESVNNQNAPITPEELGAAPVEVEQEPIDDGQGVETDSPDAEEPANLGEGSKPTETPKRGLPKDYDGLRKFSTETSQKLAERERQVEFYKSMLEDPDIAPAVKAKMAAVQKGEKFTPAAKAEPDPDTLPDYSQMHPNEVIKDLYNRVYSKVRAEVEQTFGNEIQPEIQRIKTEKAEAVIQTFFSEVPEAQTYRNELALIMQTRNVNLRDAWKIFDYDNAPTRAQKRFEEEIKLKKSANLLQSSSGTPGIKTTGKNPTAGEAINAAMDRLGVK
jgi:hypothetical protein